MSNIVGKILGKLAPRKKKMISKSERLIYVVVFLWVVFGVLGILKGSNLTQVAGYYASLTLFVSTYLWGEWKRSSKSTKLFTRGENSTREIIIYVTVFLWTILGMVGIFFTKDLNSLTVYFSSLSPFVISYIIYKTSKGAADLPIFNGKSQELVDRAITAADITKTNETIPKTTVVNTDGTNNTVVVVGTKEPKDDVDLSGITPPDDSKDVTDGI